MSIGLITFDQYQSSTTIGYLKEKGFTVERLSVDRDPNIYRVYISLLKNGRIRAGKNIILKNNIKSLQETSTSSGKKKIDHLKGRVVHDDGANWEQSMMGLNAKDLSDAHCGAIWSALHEFKGVPRYIWEDVEVTEKDVTPYKEKTLRGGQNLKYVESVKKKLSKQIHEKYGLVLHSN